MSALTKPMIHTLATIGGGSDPISAEGVLSMSKVTSAGAPGPDVFHIVFAMASHAMNPKEVVWKFADATARDSTYAAALAAISTAV